ncbi:MAG: glucosyl-3-phosphoglycerate synthase [Acidimicrobiales bacterium]|jgi:glucosyl-3-phosphoglycerate synthase
MAAAPDVTTPIASYHHGDFPLEDLKAMKKDRRISVCIPAHDEEATVGAIVGTVHRDLVEGAGLVDELLVVDDRSDDGTALAAGARLVSVPKTGGATASALGKGEGLSARDGDIVVFLDGDVENFGAHFVTGLLGPVLAFAGTMLVKACYRRPFGDSLTGGGRVTELVARPLMSLLFPELSGVVQPLAGEVAVRREARSQVELADGYGVELGVLIDISRRFAVTSIAPVDPDVRTHRNRPLHELAPQARDVPDIALRRAGVQLA